MINTNQPISAKEESILHARDYFQMLRSRWKEAFLVFLLIVVSSAVITRTMTPRYTSQMTFEIKSPAEIVTPAMGGQSPITASINTTYMQTQFELLVSERNLLAIVKKLNLASEWACSDSIAALMLRGMIRIEPRRGTDLIDVTVITTDPRLSQRICAAVATCYEEVRDAREIDLINKAINSRFEILRSRQDELERKADIVRQYIRSGQYLSSDVWRGVGGAARDGEMVETTVNHRNALKNTLEATISAMEVHTAELQKLKDEDMLNYVTRTGLLTAESYSSNKVRILNEQLKSESDSRVAMLMSGYGELHPHVKLVDQQIETTKSQLYTELMGMREAMLSQISVKKAELDVIVKELDEAKEELKKKMLEEQKINIAVQEYAAEKARYDRLENEYIADKIRMLGPREIIEVSTEASIRDTPSSPNHELALAIGGVIGLIAGIAVAFVYNYFDTSIKSLEDAERQLGLPVLGVIPRDVSLMIMQDELSPDAEAYRILRTNIELRRSSFNSNVYVVSSAHAGDGKTTTLTNLAYVFAQSGYRTLMIDGDMRRPRLDLYNDLDVKLGLSNYLGQNAELKDVVYATKEDNLYLLPSGPQPSDPSGLLSSARMDKLLQEVSKRFDIVFIDASPILGVSDSSILVSKADATIFVMQPRKMPLKMMQRALIQVQSAGGKIMGLVMNNVDLSTDSTYQYYTTYYSYYTSEARNKEEKAKAPSKANAAAKPNKTSVASHNVDSDDDSDLY